jgi:dolichyl-phosphate-mannose--protein O-mannosyl transferase
MGIFVVARLCYVLVRREESFTFIISIVKTMYDRMMLFICVMVDYLPYVFCHRSCYCHWYLE